MRLLRQLLVNTCTVLVLLLVCPTNAQTIYMMGNGNGMTIAGDGIGGRRLSPLPVEL